jgi:hypothetical protein
MFFTIRHAPSSNQLSSALCRRFPRLLPECHGGDAVLDQLFLRRFKSCSMQPPHKCKSKDLSLKICCACRSAFRSLHLPVSEAIYQVIVDHSCCLHERIPDAGAHDVNPRFFMSLLTASEFFGRCRDIGNPSAPVLHRCSTREPPDIDIEGPELLPDLEESLRVLDRRSDLQAIADDARVLQMVCDHERIVRRPVTALQAFRACGLLR